MLKNCKKKNATKMLKNVLKSEKKVITAGCFGHRSWLFWYFIMTLCLHYASLTG